MRRINLARWALDRSQTRNSHEDPITKGRSSFATPRAIPSAVDSDDGLEQEAGIEISGSKTFAICEGKAAASADACSDLGRSGLCHRRGF